MAMGTPSYSNLRLLTDFLYLISGVTCAYFEYCYRFFVKPQMKTLSQEIILVTGAGTGLGKAMCVYLAQSSPKATLVCWDINGPENEVTVKTLHCMGVQAFGYEIDICEPAAVVKCADQVKKDVGDVTVIINNAGFLHRTEPFLNLSPVEIEKSINVNFTSQCWILRQFLPQMVAKNSGHVVTINSCQGKTGCNNFSLFSASNSAVNGLIHSLKSEMRRESANNINFTTVFAGFLNTNMVSNKNICFRYPSFQPRILEPDEAAMEIVDAFRRNEEYVFVPKRTSECLSLLSHLLPPKAKAVINDIFGVQSVNIS
ncbi:unnamed protein product [Allacma fusca]|uniref:Uncharacterized protein n=1 Tax=Allacma fusca TaxID=39272 RepID=A0A8J2JG10_9HEXA|nr:unnamed protein product [Allacma fusca]